MTMPTRARILWNLEIKSHSRAIKWSHFLDCDADVRIYQIRFRIKKVHFIYKKNYYLYSNNIFENNVRDLLHL